MRILVGVFLCLFLCNVPLAKAEEKPNVEQLKRENAILQVLDGFMRSVKHGETAKSYQSYTSPAFRETTNIEAFKTFLSMYPALHRNRAIQYVGITYEENIALVAADASSYEHKDNRILFILRYEGGVWRILGIKVYPPAT